MKKKISNSQKSKKPLICASAPCRIDLGGTLDLITFYYPLMGLSPCTFNMAIGLRTTVTVFPFKKGYVKISSKGFDSATFPASRLPFDHPMGLMFAIAHYFGAAGVHIDIDSASPPRSALGGSSVAAVALIGALSKLYGPSTRFPKTKKEIALVARNIEALAAQTPCGIQDHLAAAYGGVNAWYWLAGMDGNEFIKKSVISKKNAAKLEKRILIAYCGIPHESISVNNQWVKQFMAGNFRKDWGKITALTKDFVLALSGMNIPAACKAMNAETKIRLKLTPDVLDPVGRALFAAAQKNKCGARFAGAGAGGCVWALGEESNIAILKEQWGHILTGHENARLLDATLDFDGLCVH